MHILINRTSWNVTQDNRTLFLTPSLLSRGDTPSRPIFPSLCIHSLLVKFKVLLPPHCWSILGLLCLFRQVPRPNIYLGLRPHNSPSKLRFSLPIRGEKWGFDILKNKSHMFLWSSHVRMSFCIPHNYSWHFEACNVSLNALSDAMFPVFNGEMWILRLTFLLEIWVG